MRVNRRKTIAMRSPSSTSTMQERETKGTITHHAIPPNTFTTPSLQSLIYATSNDRYPGAPGTSLHRAKVEAARATAASKREIQKELDRREEMKRLGILGVGKKRVVGGVAAVVNGNGSAATAAASNGGNSRYSTPPASERARRGQGGASNGQQHPSNSTSSSSSAASTRQPRSNGRTIANAIDHNALPVPMDATGQSSPLLTSSGRLRRPASASRGASPMPLTSQGAAHINGTLSSRVRSPIVTQVDLEGVITPVRGDDGSVTMAVVG